MGLKINTAAENTRDRHDGKNWSIVKE